MGNPIPDSPGNNNDTYSDQGKIIYKIAIKPALLPDNRHISLVSRDEGEKDPYEGLEGVIMSDEVLLEIADFMKSMKKNIYVGISSILRETFEKTKQSAADGRNVVYGIENNEILARTSRVTFRLGIAYEARNNQVK